MEPRDISDNEMAKSHARYLIGGRKKVENERVFRFEFPERPGALKKFLTGLQAGNFNVSLFHYRNHGAGAFLFQWSILIVSIRLTESYRFGRSWEDPRGHPSSTC